eukprot:GHVU01231121.1.p3 GENE.GHVU01231121.1~~GHVU01231121.1.p3  ORF type:complete len:101 (+),score=1.06 GHVU01231121.1:1003-1305(+)
MNENESMYDTAVLKHVLSGGGGETSTSTATNARYVTGGSSAGIVTNFCRMGLVCRLTKPSNGTSCPKTTQRYAPESFVFPYVFFLKGKQDLRRLSSTETT